MRGIGAGLAGLIVVLTGCSQISRTEVLENEVKELHKAIEDLKPGLGEIMSVIQQHHAKLYFAGKNQNWDLAKFERHEIQEGFEDVARWHQHIEGVTAPLSDLVKTTDSSMQELEAAIEKRSKEQFMTSFANLTMSCNRCHRSANHEFIVIQEPKGLPVTNQKFEK